MKTSLRTRSIVATVLALLLGLSAPMPLAYAQPARQNVNLVLLDYDLDSLSYTYPVLSQHLLQGTGRVRTTALLTTVTNGTTTTDPFTAIGVGDILYFNTGDTVYQRRVTAKASANSLTVDTAVDLSTNGTIGYQWSYQHFSDGTAATDGWFDLASPNISSAIQVQVDQLNVVGGIDVRIECRFGPPMSPTSAFYRNVTTAGIGAGTGATDTGIVVYEVLPEFRQCRVGLKIGGADDGAGDAGANAEKISVYVTNY